MTLPFTLENDDLAPGDFTRLRTGLSRRLQELAPCGEVAFVTAVPEGGDEETIQALRQVLEQGRPAGTADHLLLPITRRDGTVAAAAVLGDCPQLLELSAERLSTLAGEISRELARFRWWAVDPMTALPNLQHLCLEIEARTGGKQGRLFLIETAARGTGGAEAVRHGARLGAYLDSLFEGCARVHGLGPGLFGFCWPATDAAEARTIGYYLLRKLKNQVRGVVHIGLAPLGAGATDSLAAAWEAVSRARKRGPYALFAAGDEEESPLPPVPPPVMDALRRSWRRQRSFAVVMVRKDIGSGFPEQVRTLLGPTAVAAGTGDQNACFVLLPGLDNSEAEAWARGVSERIAALGAGSFSFGIASYPAPGFTKADIPLNAVKAMLHADFLGHGSIVAMDGVTLNISGDAYYNAGDLNRAIKEYTLGLNLAPTNTNLLNSLGVIYAQIDRYDKAMPLFRQAVEYDRRNFMALYNLGLAFVQQGDPMAARHYFEKALAVEDGFFELLLQLGQLYLADGHYKKALTALSRAERLVRESAEKNDTCPWERSEPWLEVDGELGRGLVLRPLGEAHAACGDPKQAMRYFQRAVRYNERDDRAMSLLGELYAAEGEGAEIAVSLCRRAVDLDDAQAGHWRRLGRAQLAAGDPEAACRSLERCLELDSRDVDAMLLLAPIYEKNGDGRRAAALYRKVLACDGTNHTAAKKLKKINRE